MERICCSEAVDLLVNARPVNRNRRSGGICGTGNLNVRDIRAANLSAPAAYFAKLRGTGWLRKNCDVITAATGDGRGECKTPVCADRQVVAAIVLQHKPRSRKTRDRAADGVAICGAGDLNARDIRASDLSAATGYSACLRGTG